VSVDNEWFEKDYYAILGVPIDATDKDITKAYRVLAKKYHPDANAADKEAHEKFSEATNAYDILSDKNERKEYDQVRAMMEQNFQGNSPGGGYGYNPPGGFGQPSDGQMSDLNDMLSGLFSRMRKPSEQGYDPNMAGSSAQSGDPRTQQHSLDLETESTITFYQALEGTTVPIVFSDGGHQQKEIKVKVPAGVNDGQKIKVSGRGKPSPKGKPGNLFVTIRVTEHPWFGRKGRTLMVKVPISFAESVVGTNVKVPTLDAPVTLKVPPNTKSGTTLRVKGKGCEIGGQKGDMLVTFEVQMPESVSEEEVKVYKQLVAMQSKNPRAKFGLEK
jgi:molecular chaperone DnaJ